METKANTTVIGLFTLVVFAIGLGFVYWIMGGSQTSNYVRYGVAFNGSVAGLRVGAPVNFNGIKRGEVAFVDLDPDDPSRTLAIISIDREVKLRRNMEIAVETQALTGLAAVAIRGRPLLSEQDLARMSPDRAVRERDGQAEILPIVTKDSPRDYLRNNPPQMISDMTQSQDLLNSARNILGRVESSLDKFNSLLAAGEGPLIASLNNIERVTGAIDPNQITRTLNNIDRISDALGRNTGEIDIIVKDTAALAKRLNTLAEKIEKAVDGFNGDGGTGMMADINGAAKSIRKLAETLDGKAGELTGAVTGLASTTKRDLEALAADGRRTLGEIDRTLRALERNPQRLLFGGSGVPEYKGR